MKLDLTEALYVNLKRHSKQSKVGRWVWKSFKQMCVEFGLELATEIRDFKKGSTTEGTGDLLYLSLLVSMLWLVVLLTATSDKDSDDTATDGSSGWKKNPDLPTKED